MNRHGVVSAVSRGQEAKTISVCWKAFLLVTGLKTLFFRQQPDLQQAHRRLFRRIELAVANARPGRHALHFARLNHRSGAQTVLVLQRSFKNIGDDFHVAMRMHAEAAAGADPVIVDDAETAKTHLGGIVVIGEGKRMPAVQPIEPGLPPLVSRSNAYHDKPSFFYVCQPDALARATLASASG